jgi:hypothetical protein
MSIQFRAFACLAFACLALVIAAQYRTILALEAELKIARVHAVGQDTRSDEDHIGVQESALRRQDLRQIQKAGASSGKFIAGRHLLGVPIVGMLPEMRKHSHLLGSSRVKNRLLRAKRANSGGNLGLVKRTKIAWITLATGKAWARQAVHWMHSSQTRFCAGHKVGIHRLSPSKMYTVLMETWNPCCRVRCTMSITWS